MRFSRLLLETTIMEMRKELVWLVAHQKREALFRSVRVREIQSCYNVIRWKKTLKFGYIFFVCNLFRENRNFGFFRMQRVCISGWAAIFCALHCSILFSTEQRTMSNCKANSKECDTSSEKKMKRHKFCWLNVLLWFFCCCCCCCFSVVVRSISSSLRLFGVSNGRYSGEPYEPTLFLLCISYEMEKNGLCSNISIFVARHF